MARGGHSEEHIAQVAWDVTPAGTTAKWLTTEDMIAWINSRQGRAVVKDHAGPGYAVVEVVKAVRPYLRTVKDGKVTDNLLYLPGGPKAQ